jgi:ubiquinone/menaquinone biosynthesis C-methylase UbiE
MSTATPMPTVLDDELDLLGSLVALNGLEIIELGCGKAELARRLVARCPGCRVAALEVDDRQHAENLEHPAADIAFVRAGAQDLPFEAARFDLALMLKSLHHVPVPLLDTALCEIRRVLKPGGRLYVSEPVFAGDLNEVIRLFHDEQEVRRAAYSAIGRAIEAGDWESIGETNFDMPVTFRDFADFEQRVIHVTFAEHRLDEATRARTRQRFDKHMRADGARFLRPIRVNLLRKRR